MTQAGTDRRLGQSPGHRRDLEEPAYAGRGLQVVIDLRPLQEAERAPTTAAYLEQLLGAFEAQPVEGEQFVVLLRAGRRDPTERLALLPIVGRRWLPPTRLLRSSAMTLDPFLLRGASVAAGSRGDGKSIFHTAGGAAPLASGLPVVATLLDLAPWELPSVYQGSLAARFGQRLRARILRDAAAVIVGAETTARSARRLLHLSPDRVHVVPLAAAPAFRPAVRFELGQTFTGAPKQMRARSDVASLVGVEPDEEMVHRIEAERSRLGLGERYLVFFARYDARKDIGTLMEALALLAGSPRPAAMPADGPWPPRLLLVNASPDDRAALAKAAARESVGEMLVYAPFLEVQRLAALVAGARASVLPALSEASGVPAIESLASGTPVVASAVGALPEIVGAAGILVEPHDARRLADALRTVWSDDAAHARLLDEARLTTLSRRRTWADVARETRMAYAAAAWPEAAWSQRSGPAEAASVGEADEAMATGRGPSTAVRHPTG